jgi:TonB family protein
MPKSATLEPESTESSIPDLRLLIAAESRSQVFLQNLRDLFHPRELPPLQIESAPAPFWSDVFVRRGLPWSRFFQSAAFHVLALAAIWGASQFLASQPHVIPQTTLTHSDVVYYTPSEYLPPLDTRRLEAAPVRPADPEYSAQPVISVPPEARNRSQTIVAAPKLQLPHDVALPNIVALAGDPRLPIAPAPAVPVSQISRLTPDMERSVIAPPPTAEKNFQQRAQQIPQTQSSVIAPPPAIDSASNRRVGELNIAQSTVIAPAPQLSVDAQRTTRAGGSALHARSPEVIAPPPAIGASQRSRAGGGMIALNLHPSVGAPPAPPIGNRRGTFAATPEGHRGASGTPGGDAKSNGSGAGKANNADLPSGLYVGKAATKAASVAGDPSPKNPNYVNPNLIANARPPKIAKTTTEGETKLSEPERAIFGSRRVYSLSLNMPNLNSAGGSWIIRFAALKPDAASGNLHSGEAPPDDLSSPTAMRKVDPAYPLELMRQNVAGTVILYGIIRADGSVHDVRVVRSVDDRLDQFAKEAVTKWQFQPAMKNGSAVDVEATFWIPFRPDRSRSGF